MDRMTHAEQYSTVEPGTSSTQRRKPFIRAIATLATASALGASLGAFASASPASADQISDARAQAAAISARLSAAQSQIAVLTGQVTAADYRLSQIQGQIETTKTQIVKDQAAVTKNQHELRKQAIADYTNSGTSNSATQLFTSNVNTSGIRSTYSSIATGNVTTTIAHLHTAQDQLQATQASLQGQQTQARSTRDQLSSAKSQASALAGQEQSMLAGVNANIANLVAQQQAAQAAAAKAAQQAAYNQKVLEAKQAQAAQGTSAQGTSAVRSTAPQTGQSGGTSTATNTGSSSSSSSSAPVSYAPAPPLAAGAAGAVQAAEGEVGVPYVWGGASPSGFDCSGLVEWSYAQVGISLPHYSGAQFASTIHISLADIAPGDLLFYGPGGSEHVAMYVGGGSMIEAPYTGATVHITGVRTDGLAGVGRVAG